MAELETSPFEVKTFTDEFEQFLVVTQTARQDAERDRDYVDHKQWTSDESNTLQERGQAPVVINRTKTKVNLLIGIERTQRRDPKALPRTPKHEKDADSVTDVLRFIADNSDFPQTSSDVFENKIVEGYGAAIIEVDPRSGEVMPRRIAWDRFYYDTHSRRLDFKDAKRLGMVIWMDEDDALALFPGKEEVIQAALYDRADDQGTETFADRPIWVDRQRKRLRICQEYFIHRGVWHLVIYTQSAFLVEPRVSPYLDDHDEPMCPIEAESAYIDRDGMRYGEVRSYIWPQDEINKRRSKFLHMLSTRQTMGDEGVVDVEDMQAQMAKPDGHINLKGGPGRRFEVLDQMDLAQGQFLLYQDAKGDIDAIGANAALGGHADNELSGRALQALQQGGLAEVERLYDIHAHWELRCYRQMWFRARQFWKAERWVRVTDSEENLKWVGINRPVTLGETLKRRADAGDETAQTQLQSMLGDPRLNTPVAVENELSQLTVDISLTTSPDYVTIQQEQFAELAQLARSYGPDKVPFEAMLELSNMTHKDRVKKLIKPDEGEVDPVQAEAQRQLVKELAELELRRKAAETANEEADVEAKRVKTRQAEAEAEAQELENRFFRETGFKDAADAQKTITVSSGG